MLRRTDMTTGRLYGLGLGPGDPELVTLKALRLLRSAAVVAYPAPEDGDSFARQIVAEWLDRGQREIRIAFPMRPGPPPAAVYDRAAAELGAVLDAGEDIAYLCQGDPLFYGSFAGILSRISAHHTVAIVPGVSSLMACAAAALAPLVQRDAMLSVIPATLPAEELAARLAEAEFAVVIKLGRHFAKLRHVLSHLGALEGAVYVERASLPNQLVAPLATVDPANVPYFATALVRGRGGGT
jgi:precorrin-2/cobalt-factor-2 C20-methyltransferase